MYVIQWLRSLLFIGQMYLMMLVLALYYIPRTVLNKNYAFHAVHSYCCWVRWTASWMVGLKSEVRGEVPTDEVLIASKHQSFFDIIMIVSVVPRPKFIMKSILQYAPILGWFGLKIGCVPVERGKRGAAIKKMVADVKSGRALPGQLIIFPQGTRVTAGAYLPYKVGAAVLQKETCQSVVPTATNVGVFWPRHGIYRKPGVAILEFLPILRPEDVSDMDTALFTAHIEQTIETASNVLMEEAGFNVPI